jgi:hypothetical protein
VVSASCECPYFFDQFEPCKHIWAVLRVAERKDVFTGSPGIAATAATLDLLDTDELIDDVDAGADKLTTPWSPVRGTKGRFWSASRAPTPPDPASILLSTLRAGDPARDTASPFRFTGGELLYVFDVPATLNGTGDMVVEVM